MFCCDVDRFFVCFLLMVAAKYPLGVNNYNYTGWSLSVDEALTLSQPGLRKKKRKGNSENSLPGKVL